MIIFLYGADDYRRGERKQFYIREYQKKHSVLGIARFDFSRVESSVRDEEGEFEKFKTFIGSRSIFDAFKLVILENVFFSKNEELKKALKGLVAVGKETTVLISEPKIPESSFSFLVKPPVIAEEFKELDGYEWELFARKEAKRRGVPLAPSAFRFLAQAYEGDGWRLVTELEKMSFLEKASIDEDDMARLDIERAPNTWELVNTLRHADPARRLVALEILFSANEPAQKLFYVLSARWPERLPAFAAHDILIKSGKLEYEEALLRLIL